MCDNAHQFAENRKSLKSGYYAAFSSITKSSTRIEKRIGRLEEAIEGCKRSARAIEEAN
jgi:hypothetical protein